MPVWAAHVIVEATPKPPTSTPPHTNPPCPTVQGRERCDSGWQGMADRHFTMPDRPPPSFMTSGSGRGRGSFEQCGGRASKSCTRRKRLSLHQPMPIDCIQVVGVDDRRRP